MEVGHAARHFKFGGTPARKAPEAVGVARLQFLGAGIAAAGVESAAAAAAVDNRAFSLHVELVILCYRVKKEKKMKGNN